MKRKSFTILIMCIMLVCFFKTKDIEKIFLKIKYPIKYEDIINQYSKEFGVDKCLIIAIIKNESNFKSDSISESNAKGLMQLLDSTAIELTKEIGLSDFDLFDEETNIKLGTYYLSKLLKYYDNKYLAIVAYNAGLGNVNKWIEDGIIKKDCSNIENIPFKETENYLRRIIRDYKIYKNLED